MELLTRSNPRHQGWQYEDASKQTIGKGRKICLYTQFDKEKAERYDPSTEISARVSEALSCTDLPYLI